MVILRLGDIKRCAFQDREAQGFVTPNPPEKCRDSSETRKSRELYGPEKPFVKLRPAYSVKLVF